MSVPSASFDRYRIADLCVIVVLGGLVAWYCVDAVQASRNIYNLIFVLPVSGLVLVLCTVQFVVGATKLRRPQTEQEPIAHIVPVVALFSAYVLSLHWLGFDVGTLLFLSLFLWIHGERRLPWLFAYSLVFAALVSLFFSKMLPYPMPMMLLPTAY